MRFFVEVNNRSHNEDANTESMSYIYRNLWLTLDPIDTSKLSKSQKRRLKRKQKEEKKEAEKSAQQEQPNTSDQPTKKKKVTHVRPNVRY